jgi:hypothetical protein
LNHDHKRAARDFFNTLLGLHSLSVNALGRELRERPAGHRSNHQNLAWAYDRSEHLKTRERYNVGTGYRATLVNVRAGIGHGSTIVFQEFTTKKRCDSTKYFLNKTAGEAISYANKTASDRTNSSEVRSWQRTYCATECLPK